MNRAETKQAIAVMQAWLEGKSIQVASPSSGKLSEQWLDLKEEQPRWDWYTLVYRVKPQPEELYVVYARSGRLVNTYSTEEVAYASARARGGTVKKFVEVM